MPGERFFAKERDRKRRAALKEVRERRAAEASRSHMPDACPVCHALACVCPDSIEPPPFELGGES